MTPPLAKTKKMNAALNVGNMAGKDEVGSQKKSIEAQINPV